MTPRCNQTMMVAFFCLTVAPWVAAIGGGQEKKAEGAKTIRVLFVGNSQIFYNDLPKLLESLSEAAAGPDRPRIEAGRALFGGASLASQWNKGTGQGTARAQIAEGKWDYVVLQDIYFAKPESLNEYAKLFHQLIQQNNSKTILLGTASVSTQYPKGFQDLHEMHVALGKELQVPVAAAGNAWLTYWGPDPSPEQRLLLYAPDKAHPGVRGSYIYACTLYAALTGQSPVGLSHRVPKLPEETISPNDAKQYQEAAWRVHQSINEK